MRRQVRRRQRGPILLLLDLSRDPILAQDLFPGFANQGNEGIRRDS